MPKTKNERIAELQNEITDIMKDYDSLARDHDLLVDRLKIHREHADKLQVVIDRKNALLREILRMVALDGLLDRSHRERNMTCRHIVMMIEAEPHSVDNDDIPF